MVMVLLRVVPASRARQRRHLCPWSVRGAVYAVPVPRQTAPHPPVSLLDRGTALYIFHTRRTGKKGHRRYSNNEFDVLALVALDRRLIAHYTLVDRRNDCVAIRVPSLRYGDGGQKGRYIEDAKFEIALDRILQHPYQ